MRSISPIASVLSAVTFSVSGGRFSGGGAAAPCPRPPRPWANRRTLAMMGTKSAMRKARTDNLQYDRYDPYVTYDRSKDPERRHLIWFGSGFKRKNADKPQVPRTRRT